MIDILYSSKIPLQSFRRRMKIEYKSGKYTTKSIKDITNWGDIHDVIDVIFL